MEGAYKPRAFNKSYKFFLFMFIAFTIYFCLRYLFLAFQIGENRGIRFNDLYQTYLTLSIFLNLYPLFTGLVLKRGTHIVGGEDVGLKFDEETRNFGGRIINLSVIIYLIIFASYVVQVIER